MAKFKVEWKSVRTEDGLTKTLHSRRVIESADELRALQAVLVDPADLQFLMIRRINEKPPKPPPTRLPSPGKRVDP